MDTSQKSLTALEGELSEIAEAIRMQAEIVAELQDHIAALIKGETVTVTKTGANRNASQSAGT